MSVRIIIDSTTDVKQEVRQRLTIVPLTIRFGDEEYIDTITINHRQFYEKLIETDVMPMTSQATPDNFSGIYRDIVNAGDDAVVITISGELSGTYQSAVIAAQEFPGRVFVVDSRTVTIGAGILTEYALSLADGGMDAKAIAEELVQVRDKVCLVAMVDTLEYLKRGGRISRTVAFAGTLLSIKPVICIRNGVIEILGKARGSKQANNLLVKEIEAAGGVDFRRPVMLGYTGLSDTLLQKYITDSAALWEGHVNELPISVVGSVVGTHAGPGAVAVAFFKN